MSTDTQLATDCQLLDELAGWCRGQENAMEGLRRGYIAERLLAIKAALSANRACVPAVWRAGDGSLDCPFEYYDTENEARNHGGGTAIPLFFATPEPAVERANGPVVHITYANEAFIPSRFEGQITSAAANIAGERVGVPGERRIGKPERRSDPGSWLRETENPIDRRVSVHPTAEPAQGEMCGGKTYWMIERGSPCEWWVGNLRIPNEDGGEWTTDSSKAQHFSEEWFAKLHAAELESWGIPGPLRATGHLDMKGPLPAENGWCGCWREEQCGYIGTERIVRDGKCRIAAGQSFVKESAGRSVEAHPPCTGANAAVPADHSPEEWKRLRSIEHLVWHLMDDSEERGDERILTDGPDMQALLKLLSEEHP